MRTDLRRGRPALVLAVLTMAVSLSERAQAQQGGLFPLAPIRRERPPCSNEDPVYKYYKQQYFGYHPTCWTPFPAGWGCPSKETADKEKAFREQPLDSRPAMDEEGPLPGEDMRQPRGTRQSDRMSPRHAADRRPLPSITICRERPRYRGAMRHRARSAGPGRGSPFEDLNNPGASMTPARRSSRGRTVAPSRNDDAPELSAPMGQPEHESRGTHGGDAMRRRVARTRQSTVLCWPWRISTHPAPRPGASSRIRSRCRLRPSPPRRSTNPAPAPRRGLISNLFGGLGLNWMRR